MPLSDKNVPDAVLTFSIQHERVLNKLESGVSYRQAWRDSAAYTGTKEDPDGSYHRRAYRWVASNYAKRMGRRMKTAPIWLHLDFAPMLSCELKSDDDRRIALLVPKNELMVFTYYGGVHRHWECVLQNLPCCDGSCCQLTGASRAHVRDTWQKLFDDLPGAQDCQAIIDRIEPEWYLGPATLPELAEFVERYPMLITHESA